MLHNRQHNDVQCVKLTSIDMCRGSTPSLQKQLAAVQNCGNFVSTVDAGKALLPASLTMHMWCACRSSSPLHLLLLA